MEILGGYDIHVGSIIAIKDMYDGSKTQVRTVGGDRNSFSFGGILPKINP